MKISVFENFISQNIAPKGVKRICVYNSKCERVGSFGVGNLTLIHTGKKLYSHGSISDVHLQRTTAQEDLQRALIYYNNEEDVSFVCIGGDLSESGYASELEEYKQCVDDYSEKPIYAISGNHETYGVYHNPNEFGGLGIEDVIQNYTGQPFYYSFEKENDVFIMLGIKSEGELFTDDELQWFYETLEANRNKRCFVYMHVFCGKEKEPVCGNSYGLYHNYCWSHPTQTELFESLMKHYKNAIHFHGHSHFRFNLQTKDCEYANIDKSNGYWSVHIPSIAVPREDADGDGTTEYYNAGSEGYVIDVYENGIHLKGRDFVKGEFLPIASYWLDTTLVNIEANTFTDSTGTINTRIE